MERLSEKKLFLRPASGLVRTLAAKDALFFNILQQGVFTVQGMWSLIMIGYLWPGSNLILAVVLTMIGTLFVDVTYAMLMNAMPRSGGDYIPQSRILSGPVGFTAGFGGVIFGSWLWSGWVGAWFGWLVVSPAAVTLGTVMNNPSMVDFGWWALSKEGIVILGALALLSAAAVFSLGLKVFRVVQYITLAGFVFFAASVVYVFGTISNAQFIQSFNSVADIWTGSSDSYHLLLDQFQAYGVYPPGMAGTLYVMPLIFGFLMWSIFAVYAQGEIKGSDSLKKVVGQIAGANIIGGLTFIAISIVVINTASQGFLAALGYHEFNWTDTYLMFPNVYYHQLAYILAKNPVFITAIVVAFALQVWYSPITHMTATSRTLFAMSFDRLLPEKIAFVDKRFHSPLVGIWIHAIMAIFLMLLIEYWLVFKGLTAAVIFAPVVGFIVTMISAVVFPYVKKTRAIYETAPASKFKVAGIPLISIVGIIGLLYTVLIAYFWIAIPELGYFNYRSIAVVAGLYVASAIWYFAWRAYQRSKGVNIDLLFTEIPPA